MKRIAVVNRGEAAGRCIRAIKELRLLEGSELSAIALYTEPDRSAPFVRQADVALSIGPALRASRDGRMRPAYLDHARVLAALRATRADAVWPGWGFVAEDAEFVAALEERDITFIGPPSAAIRALGDKIAAKQLAEEAGVPVAPWSGGQVDDDAIDIARRLGFPLMIKASAGGGGRGIRVVRAEEDLPAALASARAEANFAFGNDALYLETLVDRPRHIEVQIAADQHGDVVSFGLRDCSVQRRHQKVLEESPPPGVPEATAAAIEEAAIAMARRAAYRGLGTVEFLLDPDGTYYFLEVNPRLQVEHGVTEAITGHDLVALQIRIARGEPVGTSTPPRGHAIEVRVCAEDPQSGFTPSPGQIALLDLPTGPGIRSDCSATVGTNIPAEFDSLVAKVIAHAPTRQAAIARLRAGLSDLRLMVAGGATNKGFLLNLLDHNAIHDGGVDIGWLDREMATLSVSLHAPQALIVAAILTYLRERALQRLNFFAEAARGEPKSIPPTSGRDVDLTFHGNAYTLRVVALGAWRYRVELDQRSCIAELLDQEALACQLAIGEERYSVEYSEGPSNLQIEINGHRHRVGRDRAGEIRAAAPSVVVSIQVAAGDRVVAGQQIGVLEAMKIEIAFQTPVSGVVQEIRTRAHQRVAAGDVLVVVQPDSDDASGGAIARIELPRSESVEPTEPSRVFAEDRYQREEARREIAATVRRLILGYDTQPEEVTALQGFFDTPLPSALDQTLLRELGEIRVAVGLFADTEVLFSRQLGPADGGTARRSNDATLRLFLRRFEAEGAGLNEQFLQLMRRALRHYNIEDLRPSEEHQRALLRLYAARRQRTSRYRVIESILRHLGRLVQAGLRISEDTELSESLGTCVVLRGEVPDALADAAMELRAAFFEFPEVEKRTRLAERALADALKEIEADPGGESGLAIAADLADSAPPIFDAILGDVSAKRPAHATLALHALALRLYSPARLASSRTHEHDGTRAAVMTLDDGRSVVAAIAEVGEVDGVWQSLCETPTPESSPENLYVELFLRASTLDDLRAIAARLLAQDSIEARRYCFTALDSDGAETAIAFDREKAEIDTQRLHPETPRRIGLGRLGEFEIRRLDAPRPLFAFFGQSRTQPQDQRLFVYGEVHAAVPGFQGTLHEASFVRVFADSARCMRRLRNENPEWQRLHWNRIVLRVRLSFHLAPETLQRLMDELLPTTRHLGLDQILVKLALREDDADTTGRARELVIEPVPSGAPRTTWRDPHDQPLAPADVHAQRLAAARRRGLAYPYELISQFTSGERRGDRFIEYDLPENPDDNGENETKDGSPRSAAFPVGGRAPGENRAGIVFGISVAHTEKHPEGMRRVTIYSDPTRGMGALTRAETDRIVAALDLATDEKIPLEWFATSSGARIAMDSGTENLDSVAHVVRRIVHFTQDGGEINIVVTGTNVGAQSYFDALSTMLMHTRGILVMTLAGSMVLTGKRALDASGGVSAEDERAIGGFEDIMGPNGQAQYFARDFQEAYVILMQHYDFTYVAPGESAPRRRTTGDGRARSVADEPCLEDDWKDAPAGATVGDYLAADENPGRKKPFSIRPVMRALVDRDGGRLERWEAMRGAETAVVWDCHLGGHPICIVGIENRALPRDGHPPLDGPAEWTGATLFPRSSKKIARALNAASGNRPVVILANLAGFDGSPESMRELQLEYGAEIARAVVNFSGPILFVVTSRYHGGAYVVFSTHLNQELHAIALRGSYASVIGGGPAATVIFSEEVRRRTDDDPRVVALRQELIAAESRLEKAVLRSRLASMRSQVHGEHHSDVAAEFDRVHSVDRALEVGSLHEIIAAEDLRRALIDHLDARSRQREQSVEKQVR